MRILMTTDTIGGVWTYTLDLARALGVYGIEVVIASMGRAPSQTQQDEANTLLNVQLRPSEFKLEWMESPWEDVQQAGQWLMSLEREIKPDVVHLNGYAHGTLPFRAPIVMVAHSCVLSWFLAVKDEDAPLPQWLTYRNAVAAGLRAADVVVAPSRAMLACVDKHYGPLGETKVIYNGRDSRLYHATREKEPFILSAGRLWDDAKNISTLADATRGSDWPLYIAGEDGLSEECRRRFEGTRPLGRLKPYELAEWLSRAAIYALPARYEPFGLSALEAGLSGCALVLGNIASLREIWQDAAIYVDPNNPAQIRAEIDRLIANPPLRAAMGRRALARALNFGAGRMTEQYAQLYRSLRQPKPEFARGSQPVPMEVRCAS